MKNPLMIVLCGAAILATGCSTLHKSDSVVLQGAWSGPETGRRPEYACRLVIAGRTLDFRGADADDWCKGNFTLREDTNPRQLSGTITEAQDPEYVGKTIHAIYRFEGDTLIIAGNEPGNPAVPASFDAPSARQFKFRKN